MARIEEPYCLRCGVCHVPGAHKDRPTLAPAEKLNRAAALAQAREAAKKSEPAAPVVPPSVRAAVKAGIERMAADYVDPWAHCPHCAARRAKHAARVKRYRGKAK